jgi:hypothetical protein
MHTRNLILPCILAAASQQIKSCFVTKFQFLSKVFSYPQIRYVCILYREFGLIEKYSELSSNNSNAHISCTRITQVHLPSPSLHISQTVSHREIRGLMSCFMVVYFILHMPALSAWTEGTLHTNEPRPETSCLPGVSSSSLSLPNLAWMHAGTQ